MYEGRDIYSKNVHGKNHLTDNNMYIKQCWKNMFKNVCRHIEKRIKYKRE